MDIKRLLTAAALLPLLVLFIMKLPPIYFTGLVLLVSTAALVEFYSMYRAGLTLKLTGITLGVTMTAAMHFTGDIKDIVIVSVLLVAVVRLFAKRRPDSSLADIAPVIFGLLYIPGLLGYQISIRKEGPELLIFLYAAVWGGDALAYYIGKGIGKKKLYAEVSSKKTVAGAVGSLVGGALGALVVKTSLAPYIPMDKALLTGTAIGAITVVGDLVESMFKRDAGVKDSSSVIPGHGGVLDKIDGSLFAGPIFYWMLNAM
jgi:phosphatidate cytidylyltransferase